MGIGNPTQVFWNWAGALSLSFLSSPCRCLYPKVFSLPFSDGFRVWRLHCLWPIWNRFLLRRKMWFYSTLGRPVLFYTWTSSCSPSTICLKNIPFPAPFHVCFWHLYSRLGGCSHAVYFWVLSCISLIFMLVCVPMDLLCSLRCDIVSFQHCSFCLGLLCLIRVCASF